jgi:hypothetical protein
MVDGREDASSGSGLAFVSDVDGVLYLASGITSVRDLATTRPDAGAKPVRVGRRDRTADPDVRHH